MWRKKRQHQFMSELISVEVFYSDIKPSFPRKPSLKVLSVLSIRSGQIVSGSEGFQSCCLQCFCLASCPCCSIAFSPLAKETAPQQLFHRGLPQALPLPFPSLYCGHIVQGQKVKTHSASSLQPHKYKIHGRKSFNYICAYMGSTDVLQCIMCSTETSTSHCNTTYCNTCPLKYLAAKQELLIPH